MSLEVDLTLPLDRFVLSVTFATSARVTAIFGPSGSGKTSLLEALAGLRPAARGRLRLDDATWLDGAVHAPPHARDVGYVPQEPLLFPHLDVRGNLLAGAARARRRGLDVDATLARVVEILELGPLVDRPVAALSGGEARRVSLGRALCSGPRLLLLDEPLAGLDLALRRRILPLLRRVRDTLDVPALVVTHDPIVAQALADDMLVLREGRLAVRGAPRALLARPEVLDAAPEGLENVLGCAIVAHEGATTVVRLDGGAVDLRVGRVDGAPGEARLVGLRAQEVILAAADPGPTSAQNVLPAAVVAVTEVGPTRLVTLSLAPGVPPLAVTVTDRACAALGLAPGRRVVAIVKATGCVVYGPAAPSR